MLPVNLLLGEDEKQLCLVSQKLAKENKLPVCAQ